MHTLNVALAMRQVYPRGQLQSSSQRCEQKGVRPEMPTHGPPDEQSAPDRHGPPNMVVPPPPGHTEGSMAQSPAQVSRAGPDAMVAYMQRPAAPHQPQPFAAAQVPHEP